MSTIRDWTNPFGMIDHTEDLLIVPNTWGLLNSFGIFENVPVAQNITSFEVVTQSLASITDTVRGTRHLQNKDYSRVIRAFTIPHFTLDDYITAQDVQGKRAYGSDGVDTVDAVRARKLERIRKSYAMLLETARMQLITAGTVYAPNGTVAINYFTEFGIAQDTTDFLFGTPTSDVRGNIETVIANIQDKAFAGEAAGNIVALCSPVFFNKLINHATTVTAYQYYTSAQEPLRMRLAADGLGPQFRDFYHAGIRFIEYRGKKVDGNPFIAAGDAYAFPLDLDGLFQTHYGPADHLDFANTLGEEVYAFEYRDPKGRKHEIETESNFLNVLRRPAVIQKLTSST